MKRALLLLANGFEPLEAQGAIFVDRPVVEDGPPISSTGPGPSVERALRLLAKLTGGANAAHIRKLMRIPWSDPDRYSAPRGMPA